MKKQDLILRVNDGFLNVAYATDLLTAKNNVFQQLQTAILNGWETRYYIGLNETDFFTFLNILTRHEFTY